MQTEMSELRQYKAQLADKIKENQELINMKTPTVEEVQQYNRLKEEKVSSVASVHFTVIVMDFYCSRTHYWILEKILVNNLN